MEIAIARWQTRGGKHWLELYRCENGGYFYRGNGCGGNLTSLKSDDEAIAAMEQGPVQYCAPDNSKLGLRRTL